MCYRVFLAVIWEDDQMSMDLLTIGVGAFSFGVFLLVQVVVFRRVPQEALIKSLMRAIVCFIGLPVALTGPLFFFKVLEGSWQAWACVAVLALGIHALLCFVYGLCVFGFYEASVRLRLLHEIARAGAGGLSLEQILQRYDPEAIARLRLRRLVGAGYVVEQEGLYKITSANNVFFILDIIAGMLKRGLR